MNEFENLLSQVRTGESSGVSSQSQDAGYADLLAQVRGKPDASIVEARSITSAYADPEIEAEKLRLSKKLKDRFNEDWSTQAIDPKEAQRRIDIDDNQKILAQSPVLSGMFTDSSFSNVAHRDLGNLSGIERALNDLAITAAKGVVALPQMGVGLIGILDKGYTARAIERNVIDMGTLQDTLGLMYSPETREAKRRVGQAEGFVDTSLALLQNPSALATTVGESVPSMLAGGAVAKGLMSLGSRAVAAGFEGPALAGYLTRMFGDKAAVVAGAAGEGIVGAGSAAEQIRGESDTGLLTGSQQIAALMSGVGTAAIGYAGGSLAQKFGLTDIDTLMAGGGSSAAAAQATKTGFLKQVVGSGIAESVFEEMPQSIQEQMWQNWATDKPILEGVGNVAATGLFAGAAMGGGGGAYTSFIANKEMKEARASAAENDAVVLQEISKLAKASSVLKNSDSTFEEFVQNAADQGPVQDIYVDARVFYQTAQDAGITEDQLPPSVVEQLTEAFQTGSDLKIPLGEFAAKISTVDYFQQLAPHIKTDPNGMTQMEAQDYIDNKAEELKVEIERVLDTKKNDDVFKQSQEAVRTQVLEGLNSMGRHSAEKNEIDAIIHSSYIAARAAQTGMTPEEFFKTRPLTFQTNAVEDAATLFDQSGNRKTETPQFKNWFGDSKVVNAEGKPLVVYRADGESFNVFDKRKAKDGFFFHTSEEAAKSYGGTVRAFYLNIENPLVTSNALPNERNADDIKGTDYDGLINERSDGIEFIAVRPNQIKSVNNNGDFDPSNPNILYQEGKEKELIATHNLTAENLMHAVKMGGIPVPSLAVTKKQNALQGFGEITLIAPERMIDPKGYAKTKVFGADIYSPRYPKISYIVERKEIMRVNSDLESEQRITGAPRIDGDDIRDKGYEAFSNNGAVKARVLMRNGIKPEIVFQKPSIDEARRARLDAQGFASYMANTDYQEMMRNKDFERLAVAAYNQDEVEYGTPSRVFSIESDPDRAIAVSRKYAQEIAQNAKIQPNTPDYYPTNYALTRQIENAGLVDSLNEVSNEILSSMGAQEKIFTGFTYSGNRKYTPHTIENVVKILKKELRGGENFNYGVGSLRAKFTPEFKSIKAIRENKDRLMSKDAFEEVKAEIDHEFESIAEALGINLDTTISVIEDTPRMGLERAVKQYNNTVEISDETRQMVGEFLTRLRNLPTEYFEAKILREVGLNEFAGAVVPDNVGAKVIKALKDQGIKDIRTYKSGDEADRTAKVGEFKELLFQGNRGQIALGDDMSKTASVISVFKDGDWTTMTHEMAHYFFESDITLAADLLSRDPESLSEGEKQILKDVGSLLNYGGMVGTIQDQINQYYAAESERRRAIHEKVAESWEAYIFEGKAPSIDLLPVFRRMAAWFISVYKSMKSFFESHPEAGEINEEIRQVFDRMIATSEQIQLAKHARSMMPLFESAQAAGIDVNRFAQYHALDTEATQEAVDELRARTLKDLAWIEKARGKEVSKLKREAKAKRSVVRMEARAEIMSQPVYQAWQFLTGKMGVEEKAAVAVEKPKFSSTINEEVDSLFTAIAKLGGIDRKQLAQQWGWDEKERSPIPVFGKPLVRKTDGRGLDDMGELLASYGYLSLDENGKYDMAEFEEKFDAEYRGQEQFSIKHDYANANGEERAGERADMGRLAAGRLDLVTLKYDMGLPEQISQHLIDLKMTAKEGIHPDIVAMQFGFQSGDELVRTVAAAEDPKVMIESLTDKMMMERYGDLSSPEAIVEAADKAIYNEIRARFIAAEYNAMAKALGEREAVGTDKRGRTMTRQILPAVAKDYAQAMIDKLLVRNVKPSQYASAEARAAKNAEKAQKDGNLEVAVTEKRNQLINAYATKSAYTAKEDIGKWLDYFKRVQKAGVVPAAHYDQIMSLVSKFDLRDTSLKQLDNVASFKTWAKGQLNTGNIPPNVDALLTPEQRLQFQNEINSRDEDGELIYKNEEDQAELLAGYVDAMPVRNYKNVTVQELRGLYETIKQIEHIGKRTKKVLTDRKNREFNALVDELKAHIVEVAERTGRKAGDTRTPNDKLGQEKLSWRGFFYSHIKAANIMHIMDSKDGGPLWESLMMTANDAANGEVLDLAEAHNKVQGMLEKVKGLGDITDRPKFFPTINRSLNRQSRIAMAMNLGNDSNRQRLLGGENWTEAQIKPVLDTLTSADWEFVQGMWDYYESFRGRVGEMERQINGVEPKWIEAVPFTVQTSDGQTLNLRGGYAPVIFDPRGSGRAETFAAEKDAKQLMQAARVSSTVNKSFTKARADEVHGRPLMLSLDSLIGGVQDTIHYLHWQPWIIDANRLVKALDEPIRTYYGAEVTKLLREWVGDNAAGMRAPRDAAERRITNLSRNVSYVGLAFNVMSAVKQITGYTQSVAAIGSQWMGRGIARSLKNPREAYLGAVEKSTMMQKRATTRMRDLAETRNTIQDQGKFREFLDRGGYAMMLAMQTAVDVPTWWGAYEKAIDAGQDEEMAISMADQAVIDAQGGGLQKDLASVERQTGAIRLLTGFMSFINTTMNLNYRVIKSEQSVRNKAFDLLMINTIPTVMGVMLSMMLTPSGGDDEPEDVAKKIAADQLGFLLGQFVGIREIQQIGYAIMGAPQGDYGGSVGLRIAGDILKLSKQLGQGEMDDSLRKALINAAGDFLRLPSAQINKTITGAEALVEGDTSNPAALVFGYQKQ